MARGNSRHRNHNHSHHVGFIPAFVVSPQPCEPSYPDPISWMEKSPIPRTRVKESWGRGRSSILRTWCLVLHLHWGMGFSEQPSSFSPPGEGGGGADLQKAEPEGAIRGRGLEEAASTAFPEKGPLCGQRQSGSQPSIGQARTNQAGSPQRPRKPDTPSAIHLSISSRPHGPQPLANLHSQQAPLWFYYY